MSLTAAMFYTCCPLTKSICTRMTISKPSAGMSFSATGRPGQTLLMHVSHFLPNANDAKRRPFPAPSLNRRAVPVLCITGT